jgi:hypothetical protein
MIEESNDAPQGRTGSPVPRTVYIAKVQAFLAIKNHRRVRIMTERRQGGQADQSVEDEICLIRYYCRVGAASINAVDRVLNCVKLRWSMREVKKPPTGYRKLWMMSCLLLQMLQHEFRLDRLLTPSSTF